MEAYSDFENENESDNTVEGRIALSGKELLESPEMQEIANGVLEKFNFDIRPAKVGYFLIYPNLTKTTVARCLKATPEVKHFSGFDYIIEISGEAWDHLNEETKTLLVYHELTHVMPTYSEKKDQWVFKIRPHDFGDFFEINQQFGSDWQKLVKGTVSSLYDMNPAEEGQINF